VSAIGGPGRCARVVVLVLSCAAACLAACTSIGNAAHWRGRGLDELRVSLALAPMKMPAKPAWLVRASRGQADGRLRYSRVAGPREYDESAWVAVLESAPRGDIVARLDEHAGVPRVCLPHMDPVVCGGDQEDCFASRFVICADLARR